MLLKILGLAVTRLFVNPIVSSVAQNPFFGTNLKVVNEQRFALSSRHNGVTSPILRLFLLGISKRLRCVGPASDATLRLVPGGGVEPPRC